MSQERGLGQPRPASAASVGHRAGEAGTGGEEGGHQRPLHAHARLPSGVEGGRHRRGEAADEAVADGLVVDRPVEVAEAVGQGRGEVPSVGRLLGRIGCRHHGHVLGQHDVADRALEHDPEERGLHGRRRGGDLVEEQEPPPGELEPLGPARRGEDHPAPAGDPPVGAGLVPLDHRKPGEVRRLPDGGDDRLARPTHRLGQGPHGRGLARARRPPEQHGHPGGHGDAERGDGGVELSHRTSVPGLRRCKLAAVDGEMYLRLLVEDVVADVAQSSTGRHARRWLAFLALHAGQ